MLYRLWAQEAISHPSYNTSESLAETLDLLRGNQIQSSTSILLLSCKHLLEQITAIITQSTTASSMSQFHAFLSESLMGIQ